jgi:transposase InsO family protein
MKDDVRPLRERVALFRYGVLGDLLHLPPGSKGLGDALREKSEKTYDIPGTLRTHVAPETIRTWLKLYRKAGLDGLYPRERIDQGKSRNIPGFVQDLLCQIKEESPSLTVTDVIRATQKAGEVPPGVALPPSTVHRLLKRNGLMQKSTEEPTSKDHRRFEFESAGKLFMSDVMHGPAVPLLDSQRKKKAYLIAFIDDATRVVPFAMFQHSENTESFLPVFKQAVLRRGIPERLFVDNGSAFRSHQLELVCARLGTTLIHARAYHPQAKAKIERWFRTARQRFVRRLGADDLKNLSTLNQRLWTWVEGEYHRTPHKGLGGKTPLDRWAEVAGDVNYPKTDLDDLFLWEAKRKVAKDRTVSLHGVIYEVDAALVDTTVTLRYDPAKQRSGAIVMVFSDGRKIQDARVVDVRANCFVKRNQHAEEEKGLRFRNLDKEGMED